MKRETALRYAKELSEKMKECNGVIQTPGTSREAVKILKLWVFGSTVRGSQTPNNLDLLIHWEEMGEKKSILVRFQSARPLIFKN